ncbi:hypothetical protein V6N11_040259 [Hibiscus sabdariffa]|uniref:Uncharacterized protein n=1 Tax=Hibiscus sabdariffa TaxID=183260 RepID=A0ABR2RGY0_9ROSI
MGIQHDTGCRKVHNHSREVQVAGSKTHHHRQRVPLHGCMRPSIDNCHGMPLAKTQASTVSAASRDNICKSLNTLGHEIDWCKLCIMDPHVPTIQDTLE